jgi:hypothetical protein
VNQSEARELTKTSLVGSSYIGVIDVGNLNIDFEVTIFILADVGHF